MCCAVVRYSAALRRTLRLENIDEQFIDEAHKTNKN
jgi:hypothetical protein